MNKLLLLLRFALGLCQIFSKDVSLFGKMKEKNWEELRDMSEIQGAAAITLDGLGCVY